MAKLSPESERARLERVFRRYWRDERYRRRWSLENPGNFHMQLERDKLAEQLLRQVALWPPVGYRILDVGCGTGGPLARFVEWGAQPADLVGIDLLPEHVEAARKARPGIRFMVGDASDIDAPSGRFKLVLAFTIFSSVLEEGMSRAIAGEIDRLLAPGGVVLWYDYRVSHPRNPNTKGMRRSEVKALFPGYEMELRSVTLVPQIARSIGRVDVLYRLLSVVPFFRTHYLGVIRKPDRARYPSV